MRALLRKNKIIYKVYIKMYRLFGRNKIQKGRRKDNNQIILGDAKLKHCVIEIKGKNNLIKIGSYSLLERCLIRITGDDCEVTIGEKNTLLKMELICEDDQSSINMGSQCICAGEAHFAATEGKQIKIGNNFLCSNAVTIRTGDSHSIYNADGKRINKGKDVIISNHVWVGNQAILLKGTELEEEIVVGSGSIVSGHFSGHTVIAGNPAKIIKENISWGFQR